MSLMKSVLLSLKEKCIIPDLQSLKITIPFKALSFKAEKSERDSFRQVLF